MKQGNGRKQSKSAEEHVQYVLYSLVTGTLFPKVAFDLSETLTLESLNPCQMHCIHLYSYRVHACVHACIGTWSTD